MKLSDINVYFDLFRPVGALDGVDPTHNNFRCVIRDGKGNYKTISAVERSMREAGIMRGQVGVLTYDCVSDLDEAARSGDRVKITDVVFHNSPESVFVGRWFLVDNGTPTGWQVRAGLQEIAGAVELGAGSDYLPYEETLDGNGDSTLLILEGNGV